MVAWSSYVNTRAFGMETNVKDNVKRITFESGKDRTYLLNSGAKKTFSFKLSMNDDGDESEYKYFWAWYENTLKCGALSFLFPDLITMIGDGATTGTEYKMTATPSASGLKIKTVKLQVVEV